MIQMISLPFINKTASGKKNAGTEEKIESDVNTPVSEKRNVEQVLNSADKSVSALMSCRPSDLSTCHGAALVPVTGAEAPAPCS